MQDQIDGAEKNINELPTREAGGVSPWNKFFIYCLVAAIFFASLIGNPLFWLLLLGVVVFNYKNEGNEVYRSKSLSERIAYAFGRMPFYIRGGAVGIVPIIILPIASILGFVIPVLGVFFLYATEIVLAGPLTYLQKYTDIGLVGHTGGYFSFSIPSMIGFVLLMGTWFLIGIVSACVVKLVTKKEKLSVVIIVITLLFTLSGIILYREQL